MPSAVCAIGVDPGLHHTGYGIIRKSGNRIEHLSHGVISTSTKHPFHIRLQSIYNELTEIIRHWRPDLMVIEESIYAQNVQTAIKLGHARGTVLLVGANEGLSIYEYSPKKVKSAVVGNGAASKEQVCFMVTRLLNLKDAPISLDASDALAVALCHLQQNLIKP
jgi:crossover junction endodeoxyribonuclease RuvC